MKVGIVTLFSFWDNLDYVKPFDCAEREKIFSKKKLFVKSVAMLLKSTGICLFYTGLAFMGLNMDINNLSAT